MMATWSRQHGQLSLPHTRATAACIRLVTIYMAAVPCRDLNGAAGWIEVKAGLYVKCGVDRDVFAPSKLEVQYKEFNTGLAAL